jgi:hypothetical protein
MGRGRAKAKQTKVARDLKYRSHDTDFAALARELHGDSEDAPAGGEQDRDAQEQPDQDQSESDEYDDWRADSAR